MWLDSCVIQGSRADALLAFTPDNTFGGSMLKLIKSDAAIIAVLTLLLFAFVKFQDVSAATLPDANLYAPPATSIVPSSPEPVAESIIH